LKAFLHEVLRVYSTATGQTRVLKQDHTLPLSKPVIGRDGQLIDKVDLKKGTGVMVRMFQFIHLIAQKCTISISRLIFGVMMPQNSSPRDIWKTQNLGLRVLGVGWLLSVAVQLDACGFETYYIDISGYRFAIVEVKAILFVLLRAFKFEEREDRPGIERYGG
jgi:hypothetical protein